MSKLNDKDFNLIENFISGILSHEEEEKFRERLGEDNSLLEEYNFRIKIKKYWNDAETCLTTKDTIKQVISFEKKKRNNRFVWSIAASVVILFGISVLIYPKLNVDESSFAEMKTDSVTHKETPLFLAKQPEKGNLYTLPLTFNSKDTLLIIRKPDFPASGTISLVEQESHMEIFEMDFSQRTDSIQIPLSGIAPGDYHWKINGTSYSGNFRIQEGVSKER